MRSQCSSGGQQITNADERSARSIAGPSLPSANILSISFVLLALVFTLSAVEDGDVMGGVSLAPASQSRGSTFDVALKLK